MTATRNIDSLGGAIATIAALELRNGGTTVDLITFG